MRFNIKLDEDYTKFISKRLLILGLINLFFFYLFFFNFGLIMATFNLYFMLLVEIGFLYLEIRQETKFSNYETEIDNLKFAIGKK